MALILLMLTGVLEAGKVVMAWNRFVEKNLRKIKLLSNCNDEFVVIENYFIDVKNISGDLITWSKVTVYKDCYWLAVVDDGLDDVDGLVTDDDVEVMLLEIDAEVDEEEFDVVDEVVDEELEFDEELVPFCLILFTFPLVPAFVVTEPPDDDPKLEFVPVVDPLIELLVEVPAFLHVAHLSVVDLLLLLS